MVISPPTICYQVLRRSGTGRRSVMRGPKTAESPSMSNAIPDVRSSNKDKRRLPSSERGSLVEHRSPTESPRKSRRQFQLNPTTMAGFGCLS